MTIDPVTTEVVASRLREAAATMEHALYHSGYSPILRESKDGTAGLDRRRRPRRHRRRRHPVSLHAVSSLRCRRAGALSRATGSSRAKASSPTIPTRPAARTCLTWSRSRPAFHAAELIGFGVSVAHKADIGGLVPGSSGAAAREIFHDGLLLPPVRFQTEAGIDEAVEAIIANNSRIPEVLLGDLRAQVGATRIGVRAARGALRRIRPRHRARGDGEPDAASPRGACGLSSARGATATAEAEGFLDHDGAVKGSAGAHPCTARNNAASRLRLDFSGSLAADAGPVNLVTSTAQGGVALAVLAASDPDDSGQSRPHRAVEFVIPRGCVVSPRHPATVNHYFPTAHLVYNVVLAALGKINPARAVAPSGLGSGAVSIGYRKARSGKPAVLYELLNTSLGGTSAHDGTAIVMAMCHFTPGAPVEIIESEYPLRVRAFELVRDSAGAGQFRGGVGYAREFEMLEDSVLTVRSANHRFTAGSGGRRHRRDRRASSSIPTAPTPRYLGRSRHAS